MTEVPWRSLHPRVRVLSSLLPLRYDRHDLYHSPYHSPFALPYFVESNNHELVELLYDEHCAGFTYSGQIHDSDGVDRTVTSAFCGIFVTV
jgi:hypothetical protein